MLSLIYGILMFILLIVLLIHSILIRGDIRAYIKYGIVLGIILIVLDGAIVPFVPNFFQAMPLFQFLILDVIAFVKIVVFTCMGIYCCSTLGITDIPLMKRLAGETDNLGGSTRPNSILTVIGVITGGMAFSLILFKVTSPQLSESIKEMSKLQGAKLGISDEPSFLLALVVITFAFGEEILFRLGIQNYLAKQFKLTENRYWIAIVLTSGLWSIAHANILDPEWVKIVQIFPLGIALGFLFKKSGLESCILAHGVFNLGMICLSPYLLT